MQKSHRRSLFAFLSPEVTTRLPGSLVHHSATSSKKNRQQPTTTNLKHTGPRGYKSTNLQRAIAYKPTNLQQPTANSQKPTYNHKPTNLQGCKPTNPASTCWCCTKHLMLRTSHAPPIPCSAHPMISHALPCHLRGKPRPPAPAPVTAACHLGQGLATTVAGTGEAPAR